MIIKLTFGLLTLLFTACNENGQSNLLQTDSEARIVIDTIVGSKIITNEIPGSAYRKRAIGYFIVVGKDTSDFTCIFSESKNEGRVGIDLNVPYLKATMTYRKRLDELKVILPIAAKNFNYDSLSSIGFGRLILSGDLAIDITKQYMQEFGMSSKIVNYKTARQFLKQSKLGTDLNRVFKPYSISVYDVSIEKMFFTSKKELYWASKIETDTTNVPDKILDCMIWAKLIKE